MAKLASQASLQLREYSEFGKGVFLARFFKTGKGEYAEGDKFIGVTVPNTRKVAMEFSDLGISEIEKLLVSPIHEERLMALFILVSQFQKGDEDARNAIFNFYLSHTRYINNWDLVDSSAHKIVGAFLSDKDRKVILDLAESDNVWERRIAAISTFSFLKDGESKDTIKVAEMLLNDNHDLIQKAVGWMLREMGKSCGQKVLTDFLDRHKSKMPRTMLRYSIEKLPRDLYLHYLTTSK